MPDNIANQIYVSLDLETTGLKPESDAIMEIGAVKFQDGKQIDIFQSLVNPYRPIPYRVQTLCHISQEEVDAAPPFSALSDDLVAFLGDHPIIGHNITFDLNFLSQARVKLSNPSYDTHDLAKLLLYDIPERTLSAVAAYLQVPHPSAHRALADAEVAKEAFIALLRTLYEIDPNILNELVRLFGKTNLWLGEFLRKIATERNLNPLLGQAGFETACLGSRVRDSAEPLSPNTDPTPLDVDALSHLFDSNGSLAKSFAGYEERPQQVSMMRAAAESFNHGQHLMVEAGTGVGKSIAYLIPAAIYAYKNNTPVVISTNTINLQEQLVHKDIPDFLSALRSEPDYELTNIRISQVKGRTNYLCLRRWDILRKAEDLPTEAIELLARVQVWLPSTKTGDRSELNTDARENPFWYRMCAQPYDCMGKQCTYMHRGLCFLHRARKAAHSSHLIIVNHALLLSDTTSGGQILPDYSHLIIDEAHHLEEVATSQLGTEIRERDIFDHLDQVLRETEHEKSGFIPMLEYTIRSIDFPEKKQLGELCSLVGLAMDRAHDRVSEFFNELGRFLENYGESENEYDVALRITGAMRTQPAWSDVEINCENMIYSLEAIAKTLRKIDAMIEDLPISDTLKFEALSLFNTNGELRDQLGSLVFHHEDNSVHWLTLGRRSGLITLRSAPLHVGPILQQALYSLKDTLVLTSATLSTEGNLEYLKHRLGIEDAEELILGSPFDYENAALTYLVSDIPEPGKDGYQRAVGQTLIELCRATEGRCLVLFTSYNALRTTQAAIQAQLEEDDILVLGQGIDGPPRKLLSALSDNPRTVLLGAASFWEGIDVLGETLSVVVMVRLPFKVPTDPVFAARSETFENPFTQYALPQAAFKFKQGFGRLIRSKTDRGMMVVLDSRLVKKKYGSVFLNSLPSCRIEKGPSSDLPKIVTEWLTINSNERKRELIQ
ncbi:MAG: 3'-5' exoribonuclease [Chloroflexi bacterium]|nr:3'-5' exoribonuclease [Chloroflexota bacterium]